MNRIARRTFLAAAALFAARPRLAAAQAKPRVAIKTSRGTIVVELEPSRAPITVANFLRYVDAHAYDGGTFFRAARDANVRTEGTIVAGPRPGVHPFPPIRHESTLKTGLKHLSGTISLGRFDPGTATNSFFICVGDQPYLDAHPEAKGDNQGYAAFGHVVDGMGVVRKILSLPTNGETKFKDQRGQWLKPPVKILSARRV
jgi:peptidyl-prolyl cis-trans isomerase A (cyclophilin A)